MYLKQISVTACKFYFSLYYILLYIKYNIICSTTLHYIINISQIVDSKTVLSNHHFQ